MTSFVIAFDIGGTKVKAGIISSSGEILDKAGTSSRAREGPGGIISAAQHVRRELLENNPHVNITGCGVSTGGVVCRDSGAIRAAVDFMPGWKGFEIRAAFAGFLNKDVVVDNDGNCALFAEVHRQSLDQNDVILLALGTGLGGAIYSGGSVRGGASSLAGHFGQTLVGELFGVDEWEQLESALSGAGLALMARRILKERDLTVDPEDSFPDGHAVIKALKHNEMASEALSRWVRLLARTCHNIQWNYDPDTIIIGGGMSDAKNIWWPRFSKCLSHVNQRFGLPRDMDVRPAALGNDAAIVGAGLMAWSGLGPENGAHAS
ncbi:MAG: ROK family protein [Hyphomonadaceae bacterium]|nr:ROK family protein [Hyphomonadaceae bacterium]